MRIPKKVVIIAITISFLIGILSISCYAATVTVTTDTLKVRKGPSLDSNILGLVSVNDKLEVIKQEGDWYQVKYKEAEGYVSKEYVKIEGEIQEPTNTVPEDNKKEETKIGAIETNTEVTANSKLTVKILPLIQSITLEELEKGEKMTVISQTNGWTYIQTDHVAGWVRTDKIEEKEKKQEEPKKEETTNKSKVGYVNQPSVYVRSGPSTESEIVTSLITNAEVTITGEEGDWYQIKINGKTAYIAKRLISDKMVEVKKETKEVSNRGGNIEREENNEVVPTTVSKGEEIVSLAKQYLGKPYIYGGEGPNSFDCSGFTLFVYQQFGISLSHSATAQSRQGTFVNKENIQAGDLVIFNDEENAGIGHVGIYMGDGNFIHGSSAVGEVTTTPLSKQYYVQRYVTARRML